MAKKVATRTTTATITLEEATDIAPLCGAAVGEVDAALEAEEETAAAPAAAGVEELGALLAAARALPTSGGTMMGLGELRLIEPSAFNWSGFMAKTLRVNMTFSITRSYDQEGMLLMSMSEPQFAAADPLVMF